MIIEIGWWIIPLIITIAAFIWARVSTPNEPGGWMPDITPLLTYGFALIISLIAWCVYGLLT